MDSQPDGLMPLADLQAILTQIAMQDIEAFEQFALSVTVTFEDFLRTTEPDHPALVHLDEYRMLHPDVTVDEYRP